MFSVCRLYEAGTRRPMAFSPSTDMGLTDIEMAHNMDYDDPYFDDRVGYEMEYEVTISFSGHCPWMPSVVQWPINAFTCSVILTFAKLYNDLPL